MLGPYVLMSANYVKLWILFSWSCDWKSNWRHKDYLKAIQENDDFVTSTLTLIPHN